MCLLYYGQYFVINIFGVSEHIMYFSVAGDVFLDELLKLGLLYVFDEFANSPSQDLYKSVFPPSVYESLFVQSHQ